MNKWLRNWQRWYLWVVLPLAGILLLWLSESALGNAQAAVGNQITYQGTLLESGQPVDGTRDMTFRLYNDELCTSQVGPDIVRNGVTVSEGYFTVLLDVNPAFVDGQALWLQVDVEGSAFECQAISAVPYALSLRPGAVIRGATSSANGLLELENQGPGQALRVTSSDGMVLYGATAGGPAIYGYAGSGYGLRGVSSASGSAAVRGDTSTANTFGGDFYSQQGSGVQGATVSVKATPVPGIGETYVAGVRGLAQSGGYVYGVYGETTAGMNGSGVHATNLGSGALAPDLELGAGGSNGNGVLASDQLEPSSNLVLLSNDDISLRLDADGSFENSQLGLSDRNGVEVFTVDDDGNLVTQGEATAENGLRTGATTGDGLFVFEAGSYAAAGTDGSANGIEIRSANNDGLMVGGNGGDGVDIWNAAQNGLYVRSAGGHGLFVQSADQNGVHIADAGAYGLHISDAVADNYLAGDTGIGTSTPTNRLHVRDSISGAASVPNHVAQIENAATGSPDVLVLKVGEVAANISGGNNFISFVDGANTSLGAIQGTGSGGVTLAGPGNDYAEWLPRLDAAEGIQEGDVLGVFGGRVSRKTAGADMIMAASTGPIVSGNDPGEGQRHEYVLVAFIGQVAIRVRGPVQAGDLIVPSGLQDGTAVAVSPASLTVAQLTQVLGQAWESSDQPGIKPVRTLVGLVQPSALAGSLQSLDARLSALEETMGLGQSQP